MENNGTRKVLDFFSNPHLSLVVKELLYQFYSILFLALYCDRHFSQNKIVEMSLVKTK